MAAEGDPVESLSAVTVITRDMAQAVTFYEALGFRRLFGGPQEAFTSYRAGDSFLNLQLAPEGTAPGVGWGRSIFWVDDVDAMHQRALTAGFFPRTAPADAPWGERYFHIADPDGHELSFARPLTS